MTQEEINNEVMRAIMRLTKKETLSCREVRGKHSGLRIVVTNPATVGDL